MNISVKKARSKESLTQVIASELVFVWTSLQDENAKTITWHLNHVKLGLKAISKIKKDCWYDCYDRYQDFACESGVASACTIPSCGERKSKR